MTTEFANSDSTEATLASGDTISVRAESQRADSLEVFIDDGAGGSPESYDLTVEFYSTEAGAWFDVKQFSSSGNGDKNPDLSQSVKESVTAQEVRVTLTAGSAADYRLVMETFEKK